MSGQLRVDLDALSETASALVVLSNQFRNARCRADAAGDAAGHPAVAGALREFGENWRHHRNALINSLEAVSDMAAQSRQTYADTDRELAAKLEQAR